MVMSLAVKTEAGSLDYVFYNVWKTMPKYAWAERDGIKDPHNIFFNILSH